MNEENQLIEINIDTDLYIRRKHLYERANWLRREREQDRKEIRRLEHKKLVNLWMKQKRCRSCGSEKRIENRVYCEHCTMLRRKSARKSRRKKQIIRLSKELGIKIQGVKNK